MQNKQTNTEKHMLTSKRGRCKSVQVKFVLPGPWMMLLYGGKNRTNAIVAVWLIDTRRTVRFTKAPYSCICTCRQNSTHERQSNACAALSPPNILGPTVVSSIALKKNIRTVMNVEISTFSKAPVLASGALPEKHFQTSH
jgi:hypothetical protein